MARKRASDRGDGAPKIPRPPGRPPTGEVSRYETDRQLAIQKERKIRLENDRAEGLLLEAKAVERETFSSFRVVRESVLNVGPRIAAQLAAMTDAAEILRLLDREHRLALDSGAQTLDPDAS